LTNLLKKSSGIYEWDEACNEACETLKGILVKLHVLKLPDFDKDFEKSTLMLLTLQSEEFGARWKVDGI
jgi:hypothetical protein